MPVSLAWHLLPLDYDFELRLVSDHRRLVVKAYLNRLGLPHEVIEIAGSNAPEILLF